MADVVPTHAVEMSPDEQLDATSAYERLTHRDTAVRLFTPSRRLLIDERSYECTVTRDEYYGSREYGRVDA